MDVKQENNNQEIDLVYLFKKIGEFFRSVCFFLVRLLKFIYRNKLLVICFIIIGIILGLILDQKDSNKYKTEIIVVPNFESVDLLYSEVESFNINLKKNKLNNQFLDNVIKLEVKPIENLNNVLNNKDNLEIFKALTENVKNLSDVFDKEQLKKNYKYHVITVTTNSTSNLEKITNYFLKSINDKSYYKVRSKLALANQEQAKLQAEKSIEQINRILENLGSGSLSGVGKDLNINNYDQLSNVIELKSFYIKELASINTRLIEFRSAIYPVDISYNNKVNSKIYQKFTVLLPLIFVGVFLLISYIKYFFNKYNRLYLNTYQ